jgi:hypothetical protein
LPDATLLEAVEAVRKAGGNKAEAARALGMEYHTFNARCKVAEAKGFVRAAPAPSAHVPLPMLIERLKDDYARKRENADATKLARVHVTMDGPVGMLVFGDPHLGSHLTNWPALERDINLVKDTEGLFATNIGDTGDNWTGKLAHLWADNEMSASTEARLTHWFIEELADQWLLLLYGNHCHDTETEALTRHGWRSHDQIEVGDEVLSINTATGMSEWSAVTQKHVKQYAGEMVGLDMLGMSFNVTPEHRLLHKRRDYLKRWSGLQYAPAGSMARGRVAFALSAKSGRPEYELTDDQIRVAGWILTDGSIAPTKSITPAVRVYQSKDATALEAALTGAGLTYNVRQRERDTQSICGRALVKAPLPERVFELDAPSARLALTWVEGKGKLPSWAGSLSDRQFDVFLDALMAGDGSWATRSDDQSSGVLYGDERFLEQVQALAIQHGWSAWLSRPRPNDCRLNLARREEMQVDWKGVRSDYDGAVWCLTTEHGNFAVRRRGMPHFSGNCLWSGAGSALPWLAQQHGILDANWSQRVALEFPNGREVRIGAYHGANGHSMWNSVHGGIKLAKMGPRDHLVCAGHIHQSQILYPVVDPGSGEWSTVLQVGSYKDLADNYGKRLGGGERNAFPSAVVIINPAAKTPAGLLRVFPDTEEGADFLTYLRGKKA